MAKKRLYLFLSFILTIFLPIFTIINSIFNYYDINTCFSIININSSGINLLFIKHAYPFWKIFATLMLTIKILLFFLLPIISYIRKQKGLYVFEFIIVFLDSFFIMTLTKDYFIVILNMLYHALLLFILWKTIMHTNIEDNSMS